MFLVPAWNSDFHCLISISFDLYNLSVCSRSRPILTGSFAIFQLRVDFSKYLPNMNIFVIGFPKQYDWFFFVFSAKIIVLYTFIKYCSE